MKKIFCLFFTLLCFLLSGCDINVIENKSTPSAYEIAMADEKIVIVLDAGHGLLDVGALNEENLGDVTEADINFKIATLLSEKLTERGYTVIMSHDGVTKPETEYDDGEATYGPKERADFANSTEEDLFISIHCDSFPQNADVYGTRLYYGVDTPNSSELDEMIASDLKVKLDENFGEYKESKLMPMKGTDAYTVLYHTKAPSVLIECGFITNKDDAARMIDEKWQKDFVTALADGIDLYFEK